MATKGSQIEVLATMKLTPSAPFPFVYSCQSYSYGCQCFLNGELDGDVYISEKYRPESPMLMERFDKGDQNIFKRSMGQRCISDEKAENLNTHLCG